jgi:hypothetical protein
MRERVGRAIFGKDWIGGLSNAEWTLIQQHGPARRQIQRYDGSFVSLPHIKPCPPSLRAKLDRALGRAERASAQYVTVDSWIQDHQLPVDPSRPAKLKTFNAALRRAFPRPATPTKGKPGPKPKVRERVIAEMRAHDQNALGAMSDKDLEFQFKCNRETARKARESVLCK